MKSHKIRSVFTILSLFAGIAALAAGSVGAVSIHGSVVNGTTGQADVAADVAIINPAAGMAPIHTAKAAGGKFSIDKLDPGVYIARLTYRDVTYNQQFQIVGDEHADVAITVYEPTTSWEGVRIVVPHFTAARHGDHLQIERVYDIYNESVPPRTIVGDDAYFRFALPAQMHNFDGMYVQYGEVPVDRQPTETGEEGVYRLDYPIRPGLTRVVMAYTTEYEAGSVSLDERIQHDIESLKIFATDSEMTIASSSHDLVTEEGAHAGVSWDINDLKKGTALNLAFSGGSSQPEPAANQQSMVIVVPNDAERLSMLLMAVLLLAMVAFVVIAIKEPRIAGTEALHLGEYRDVLLARLAKLDDVHETGAIPAAAYHAKRAEIKNQVASLIYRLNSGGRRAGGSKKASKAKTGGKGSGSK